MQLKGPLCIPLGHKWAPDKESPGPEPVMRCARCGRTAIFSEETRSKMRRVGQGHDDFGNPLP
jgi:hypothetical protein